MKKMQDIKRVMKDIWEESKSYRVSDTVHMTEKQILTRLNRDGVLPQFSDSGLLMGKGMDPLHFCFLFRRYFSLLRAFLFFWPTTFASCFGGTTHFYVPFYFLADCDEETMLCRHELLRNQFAAAVGKRMISERTISTGKNSIMEHHRTVQWAEKEYIALLQLVQSNSGAIDQQVRSFNKDNPSKYFMDYVRMLTDNVQFNAPNSAGYSVWGFS